MSEMLNNIKSIRVLGRTKFWSSLIRRSAPITFVQTVETALA